jgi:hypothetical protein
MPNLETSDLSPSRRTSIAKALLRSGIVLLVLASFALWHFPGGMLPIHLVSARLWHQISAPLFILGTLPFTLTVLIESGRFLGGASRNRERGLAAFCTCGSLGLPRSILSIVTWLHVSPHSSSTYAA